MAQLLQLIKVLINGMIGQDGSYLGELLLVKGYEVQGIKRRALLLTARRTELLRANGHNVVVAREEG